MSKKHWYKIVLAGIIVVVALFWVLNAVGLEAFAGFNGYWAMTIIAGLSGVVFLLKGLFSKGNNIQKKGSILLGTILIILGIVSLALNFAFAGAKWFVPLIILVLAIAFLLSYVAVGAKKWDTGDNQKAGYKNYHQRKAEEEKAKKEKNED